MLNFIYGRAGSGKSTYVNNLIFTLAKEQKKELVLIVPEQFSFSSERKMLELLGPVDCNRVEVVMSFTHIADSVYKLYGGNRLPELDKSGKNMLMSMALDAVKDNLQVIIPKKGSASVLDDMVSLSSELRQGDISASMLEKVSEKVDDELLKKKLCDVSLIMNAYDALLQGKYYDPDDKLTTLAKALEDFHFFKDKIVFIDGFNGFTGQEYKIIERILRQADETYISLCTDKLFSDEECSLFEPVQKTVRILKSIADKNGIGIRKEIELSSSDYKSEELELLEKGLYSSSFEKGEKCENIKIVKAKNIIEECEYVACETKRLLKNGYRCRDIAIVSRSGEPYDTYMKASLRKCGVPVFTDKRHPVEEQPLCVFIKCAMEIAVSGYRSENIFRYLKTGVAGIGFDDISKIERYVLLWKINGYSWERDFTENPDGLGAAVRESTVQKLEEINEIRRRIMMPLSRFYRKINEGTNGEETARCIYKLLQDVEAGENLKKIAIELEDNGETELAFEQERVWDMVMSILNDLANLVGDRVKPKDEYKSLIETAIRVQDLGNLPQGLDEVTVGDALRTRVNEPKAVFVLGVNEGVFPMYPSEKGTFTDRERVLMNGAGLDISDTVEDKIFEERFLCYKTLCSAKEKLYVSFVSRDLSGMEIPPSDILDAVRRIFDDTEIIETESLSAEDFIESEETAFRVMTSNWRSNTPLSETLKQFFCEKDEYNGKLKSLERSGGKKDYKIEDESVARALFGENMYESPSRVETYHQCAFKYFCRYGINAKPSEVSELDPRRRGTVIHFALENLVSIFGIKALSEMDDETLKKETKNILASYAEEFMGGLSSKSERFVYLYGMYEKTVFELVKQLINEFTVSKFEPVDFELSIDRDSEVKSYEIPLKTGGVISLRGTIDRVDKMEYDGKSYVRVVDYKTGGKDFVLSDVLHGLNMQMLVYLFSIWENGTEKYGDVVPAGVLYMPSGVKTISADKNVSEEELDKERKKQSKMKGLVLENTIVIEGMEDGGKGIFIPAEIDKNGNAKGDVISLLQMGKLKTRIDSLLQKMAEELHLGAINACPVSGTDYDKVCEYCDYGDICCIEEDDERNEIEKLRLKETLDIIDGETEVAENG